MQRKPSYETLIKRFVVGVEKTKNIDYLDRASIRRNNAGVDQYRKAAKQIGEVYPERVEDFAILLNSDDLRLRKCCAICMVELMNCSDEQYDRAYSTVLELYLSCTDSLERLNTEYWLERNKKR